jgi:predicted dinucleotide-binding enzyme
VEAVRWVKVQPLGQALADAVAGVFVASVTTPANAILRRRARLALAANRRAKTNFIANP